MFNSLYNKSMKKIKIIFVLAILICISYFCFVSKNEVLAYTAAQCASLKDTKDDATGLK